MTASLKIFLLSLFILLLGSVAFAEELIAYSRLTDGYWQIWVMTPDGKNERQVTVSKQDKRDPVWMDKEGTLLFRTANGELFKVGLEGQNEKRLLERYGIINNPHFSAVTQKILFVRFDPRVPDINDIWKSDLKGEHTVLLTKENRAQYHPVFSPDGSKIVYVKANEDKKSHHLWIMNNDGQNPRQLTDGAGLDTLPDFSKDGETILFTSNRDSKSFEIYEINLETGKIDQLTRDPRLDTNACFSVDGKRIAFVSTRSGSQQIWVMSASGGDRNEADLRQLTSGEESVDPVWGEVEDK